MENLVTIGAFAEATRISPKALRLYAANGLLPPAWVDAESGYRYYRSDQLHTARLIALLRSAGMPLREIRGFLVDPSAEAVERYEGRLERELADRRRVLRYVRRIMEEEPMFDVMVKDAPSQRYVSRTRRVRISELEPFILETIGELSTDDADGYPFAVYHGQVNELDDGPVEVGVPRTDGDDELSAGEVAYVTIAGEQCDFPQILGAYDAIARWVSEHGRELAGPPREVYLNAVGEPMRMEIVWQLR